MSDIPQIGTQGTTGTVPIHSTDEAMEKINREMGEKTAFEEAKNKGMGYINIALTPINPDILYLVRPEIAKSAQILPFFRIGKKIRIAVVKPENQLTEQALQDLRNRGYLLNLNLASESGMKEALKIYDTEYHETHEIENVLDEETLEAYEKEIENLTQLKEKLKDVTSEEALNYINVGAIKTGASDIHYQPEEKNVMVRFRIDGVLQEIFRIERPLFENIANQIKYKAKMKLNINNVPQDGRFSFVINKRKIDVRVSAIPTEFGETFVCRLLDSRRSAFEYDKLGFQGFALDHIKKITKLTNGMVLVTGPTGSGKTTTLYSILSAFNNPEKKIITLEDPIEYNLPLISQSQINEKRGYDFANGLRAILRQDPDIIMIGEIRDLPTAETCAQASLTGHVVLTTLHTNSAVETIPRLLNMGLPPFMIAPTLSIIIAQRLVRRVCPKCGVERKLLALEKQELETAIQNIHAVSPGTKITLPEKVKKPVGCPACSHTGFAGQIAVVEVLRVDSDIKNLILNGASTAIIFDTARKKNMLTMREDGLMKMIEGITTLEEVTRMMAA
ncbi:type II/IV secretion system protein [Candidatus Peregrinibacteria bacterium]|nr:type II/IV secretion system protein [Candidatus Peregrinibacteria bacterium]